VLAAAGNDSQAAREALSTLCQTYWYPLYAYLRRRGLDPEDARDLTQGFLTSLIERQDFEGLRQDRGRFRAFLLAALKHGGRQLIPLENAEGQYVVEPKDDATPETLFERRWALTVVERLLTELRTQWTAQGRASEFDELKACLLGQAPAGGYAAVAARLGTSEGAVKAAVHRLRRRFQSLLRQRVAETVADGGDVDDEIRHLIQALST
jgi:RNA polymerase sigma-70 factor (ECF subfamily)